MKLKGPMLVVKDMEKSKKFYKDILGLRVIMDFGENVTLTGGISLQEINKWKEFINKEVEFLGNDAEIYFEEDDFDKFIEKLNNIKNINYVHNVIEHNWGQRAVRIYDPDGHIIEIAENLKVVCKRFLDSGMTNKEVATRMDVPLKFVDFCNK